MPRNRPAPARFIPPKSSGPASRSSPEAEGAADGAGTSLDKGLAVLERLSAARSGAGVSELARDLDLPKSTVARLLLVLGGRGYVWREPGSRPRYRIGPRALELTANALDELLVVAQARPHLYDLAGKTGRVACLGVLWAGVAIVVDLVQPPGATPAALLHDPVAVGRGAPAYASSPGKAILAHRSPEDVAHFLAAARLARRTARTITSPQAFAEHLAAIRAQGWASNDGESTEAGTSVAAPIFGHTGEALAAVAVVDTHAPGEAPPAETVAAVVDAARRISFHLGHHPRAFR